MVFDSRILPTPGTNHWLLAVPSAVLVRVILRALNVPAGTVTTSLAASVVQFSVIILFEAGLLAEVCASM